MLKDEEIEKKIAAELCIHLYQTYQKDYDQDEIRVLLGHVDKALFIEFRNGKLSLAQLKARVAERRGFAKYKVIDDIYADLSQAERDKLSKRSAMTKFLFGDNA